MTGGYRRSGLRLSTPTRLLFRANDAAFSRPQTRPPGWRRPRRGRAQPDLTGVFEDSALLMAGLCPMPGYFVEY
jgi:hypothetical protein